jgi:DNA-directed RNA polymerase specialized sigma24 family protein
MTPAFATRVRAERAFEQLYRRHVGDVYRYAFALLQDEERAEDITRTVFLNAFNALELGERPDSPHSWLIGIAHGLCRPDGVRRMRAAGAELLDPSQPPQPGRLRDLACDEAERSVSLQLDHELPRRDLMRLLAHLRRCPDCAAFARRQRLQRTALRGLAVVPLPRTLEAGRRFRRV